MAVRRMSPGAKLALFLLVPAVIIGALFFAWRAISDFLPSSGPSFPEEVVAGGTFEPGSVVDVHGTETEAILDGVSQRIQAANPTDEWLAEFDAECNDDNLCTAPAPDSAEASADGEAGGDEGGFMGTGVTLGTLAAGLLGAWVLYVILNEEN